MIEELYNFQSHVITELSVSWLMPMTQGVLAHLMTSEAVEADLGGFRPGSLCYLVLFDESE